MVFGIECTKFMVYFGEELVTFGCVWTFFSHGNLSLFQRILN
jgi:hypothetical protein